MPLRRLNGEALKLMAGLDENARLFLARSLEQGRVVLFTGAGFSRDAVSVSGDPIPLGSELKELLWELAFPGDPIDESSLGEVFDVAVRQKQSQVGELLRERLTVNRESLPEYYRTYLEIPWYRIYTLNFDNILPAIQARFGLQTDIEIVSAIKDQISPANVLSAVHLNGTLDDYPDVTVSPPQYGRRTSSPDFSYTTLVKDLVSQPVVFIGTQLDEPPLWHHVQLRGDRPAGRELRPKSFLVTPSLPAARRAMLEAFNIRHVAMNTEEFADTCLAPVASRSIARPLSRGPEGRSLVNLDEAIREPSEQLEDFLLGREPTWSDITDGYAVQRSFEDDLAKGLLANRPDALVISGTAGAGKSTVLRRLALSLRVAGVNAVWIRRDASESLGKIRAEALASDADFVFIDQAERFGQRGVEFLRAIAESGGKGVVAAYASTAVDELNVEPALVGLDASIFFIPNLTDQDITALIDALEAANRLGKLTGKSRSEQVEAFRQRAHRQLLVAMIEATTGERFEQKIIQECENLAPDLQLLYAATALATSERFKLRMEDFLGVLSDLSPEGLGIVDRLVRQHLILQSPSGTYVARHPVIAREVVGYYRSSGQLGEAVARLAFVLASKVDVDDRGTPQRRLLVRLINHDYVHELLATRSQVRDFYADLEPLLRGDAHYWLQRGGYELERGDLRQAEVFLSNARGLVRNDFMVETEWAYLMLERACRNPTEAGAPTWFREGCDLLLEIIDRWGARTPNTYVVLAQTSARWVRLARLSKREAVDLLELVRATMTSGAQHHGGNRQFVAARDEIDRAYLELSLVVE